MQNPGRFRGPAVSERSGLAPCSFVQDEPNANVSEFERRETIADEVGAALLVAESALEQLGSYLNNDPQLADVEVFSASEADLHVSDAGRACPGFLGAVDRLGDEVGQQFGEASQLTFRHIAQVGDIYEWHDIILSAGSARRMDPAVWGSSRVARWRSVLLGEVAASKRPGRFQ